MLSTHPANPYPLTTAVVDERRCAADRDQLVRLAFASRGTAQACCPDCCEEDCCDGASRPAGRCCDDACCEQAPEGAGRAVRHGALARAGASGGVGLLAIV